MTESVEVFPTHVSSEVSIQLETLTVAASAVALDPRYAYALGRLV